MAENYVATKEDGRLKGSLHGVNNSEDVKKDLISTTGIILALFNLPEW